MKEIINDEKRIKDLFKQAIIEVLQERKDIVYDVFEGIIEDIALAKAIKEGETSESVTKEQVYNMLKGKN